jgi:hypothetical protein
MIFHTYMRIICGIIAILGGASLIYTLLAGRAGFGANPPLRATNPQDYWIGVTRLACIVLGMALAAWVVKDSGISPAIGLSVFLSNLLTALVTGRFEWETDGGRIDRPARFWGWITFYLLLNLMLVAMLIWP